MRKNVSILVGSGFSIPEGLPSVTTLNKRLSKIDESEILIHSDQRAFFLNGQNDPNRWCNEDERLFVQDFLQFYNTNIIDSVDGFHYETFYDFYSGYLKGGENKDVIDAFCKQFNDKYWNDPEMHRDPFNMIDAFNRTFNQLLASQLHSLKYFEDTSLLGYYLYDPFVRILSRLLNSNDVKFHTLNHDLFFDWLGRKHVSLCQHFSDGYQLEGSPFYGMLEYRSEMNGKYINKNYYVKLEHFNESFNKALSFYKLHGSIYNTLVSVADGSLTHVRVKDNFAISRFFIERQNLETEEFFMEALWDEVAPDFLSGTTNKTRYYTHDPYYIRLFNYFESNLKSSDLLIVIGYGFQDPGINEYLDRYYLSRGGKMIVVDPAMPKSKLLDKYEYTFVNKSIVDVSYEEWLQIIPDSLLPELEEEFKY